MRRDQVPTPALILDLDALDANIGTMVAHARRHGVGLRPHAKSHKCVEIARRLAAAGANGPCCATIAEAEAMAAGGIQGILVTSPLVTDDQLDRLGRLLRRGADIMLALDDPGSLAAPAALARAAGRSLPVVVDLDPEMGRTGCPEPADAVALARQVEAEPGLVFNGVQCYWGQLQQVLPLEERARGVAYHAGRVRQLVEQLRAAGLPPAIVTGSGTGTSWLDVEEQVFTELQVGSFIFLDSIYGANPITPSGNPFRPSLTLAASVVSARHPGRYTINAGLKALATDCGRPTPLRGAPQGSTYRFMGDEHGQIEAPEDTLGLGSVIELLTSHCDPTVNLHGRYHVVQGDEVVDVWPVVARGY